MCQAQHRWRTICCILFTDSEIAAKHLRTRLEHIGNKNSGLAGQNRTLEKSYKRRTLRLVLDIEIHEVSMATKAKLSVVLKADSTVVAESDDAILWQKILAAIQGGSTLPDESRKREIDPPDDLSGAGDAGSDKAVARFAKSIGVSVETVIGALSPSSEPPYLHLDHHCWAQMKKGTPSRGVGSLSATGLAATMLALWFKEAKLDLHATQALASDVLDTINVTDPNASRGIKNTKWLQGRAGGVVVINAAEIAKAIELTRSFCAKQWIGSSKAA